MTYVNRLLGLVKMDDEEANTGDEIVSTRSGSVISGKTTDEIGEMGS